MEWEFYNDLHSCRDMAVRIVDLRGGLLLGFCDAGW
jgi:hypothetical protein